jgi:hypothetical protein
MKVVPIVVLTVAGLVGGGYWLETRRQHEAASWAVECGAKEVETGIFDLREANRRFADVETVATATPRIALSPQITTLQRIRDEAKGVRTPRCLMEAHATVLASMDERINAFVAFLAQDDGGATTHLEQALLHRQALEGEFDRAKQKALSHWRSS